jgi:hypothetical protein
MNERFLTRSDFCEFVACEFFNSHRIYRHHLGGSGRVITSNGAEARFVALDRQHPTDTMKASIEAPKIRDVRELEFRFETQAFSKR